MVWSKITPMCREYTHPREHPDSLCFATINANTKIGPILNIRISQVFCIYGLEVQIPSLSRPRYSSWILICRGLERFVDELHLHDRHINTPSSSLLRQRNDSEHVVMASEQPSSGKPVRGRQDPERDEWDSEPASTRATGAYRNNSETVVHLSKINSGTRETGTRVYIKKVVPMQDRSRFVHFTQMKETLYHPTSQRW